MRTLIHTDSAVGKRLTFFGLALKASPPLLSRSRQLIFLCGANQATNTPSVRRTSLKTFIHRVSATSTVIYAEGIFNELRKFGSQKNVLDLEHRISEIADKVVIILESPSAYCELGAFAHETLRHKLIVINDSQYRHSDSFINLGPIAAMEEVRAPVIWYPMSTNGVSVMDGIGATFSDIEKAIDYKSSSGIAVKYETLLELGSNKTCLYFIHDIILFAGPVSHVEIITILLYIFGKKNFDSLKNLLGVLRESQLISVSQVDDEDIRVYRASSTDFFLKYRVDVYALMSAFRTHHLKLHPNRFLK